MFEQRIGGVIADGVEAVAGEERHLAAAAATDVGGTAAGFEIAPHHLMQIGRGRLVVPVLGELGRTLVVGGKRRAIHHAAPTVPPLMTVASPATASRPVATTTRLRPARLAA